MAETIACEGIKATELAAAVTTIATWRSLAGLADDIAHGRSHDWLELMHLGMKALMAPSLSQGTPDPCRALVELCAEIAVSSDPHQHYHEIHRLAREVVRRCDQAEAGLQLIAALIPVRVA